MKILTSFIFLILIQPLFAQQPCWIRLDADLPQGGHGSAVGVDLQNNIYVLSSFSYPEWWNHGTTIIKYSPSGDKLWSHSYQVDTASVSGFVVNDQGSSFVIYEESGFYYFGGIYAVDSSGNEIFSHSFYDYTFFSVDCDQQGNSYVTGLKAFSFNNFELVLIKFNTTGEIEWERILNTPNSNSYGRSVVATDSVVYAAGPTWYSHIVIKYDPLGNSLDTAYFFHDPEEEYYYRSLHGQVDQSGNIYFYALCQELIGIWHSFIYKFNYSLEQQWHDSTTLTNERLLDLTIDQSQDLVFCGYDYSNSRPLRIKYNQNGIKEWSIVLADGIGEFWSVASSGDNNFFTGRVHFADTIEKMLVYMTDPNGNFKSQYIYPTTSGCSSRGYGNLVDHNNQVVAVGKYEDTLSYCLTVKFDAITGDIKVNNDDNAIILYPNPVSENLFVTSSITGKYEIFNSQGNHISKGTITPGITSLPVSDFPSGIYFIHIGTSSYKFLKY
jgi:hypothetical protein